MGLAAVLDIDLDRRMRGGDAVQQAVERDVVLADEEGQEVAMLGEQPLDDLLERIATAHPGIEVDVQDGGQPHYHLLLSAE